MVRITTSTVTANAGNLLASYPGGIFAVRVLVSTTVTFPHGSSQVNETPPSRPPWSRSSLYGSAASRQRPVGEVDDAVVVGLAGTKRQLPGLRVLRKEAWAGPARQRVDEKMQLVDEAVRQHRPHQRAAAADIEVAVELLLQAADDVAVVRPDGLRIPHVPSVRDPETT